MVYILAFVNLSYFGFAPNFVHTRFGAFCFGACCVHSSVFMAFVFVVFQCVGVTVSFLFHPGCWMVHPGCWMVHPGCWMVHPVGCWFCDIIFPFQPCKGCSLSLRRFNVCLLVCQQAKLTNKNYVFVICWLCFSVSIQ